MANQLEPTAANTPLEIHESSFSLTRPTMKWARAKKGFQYLLVQPLLRNDALLLLVQPDLLAFIDVQSEANSRIGPAVEQFILNRLRQDGTQPFLNNNEGGPVPKFGAGNDNDDPSEVSRHYQADGRGYAEIAAQSGGSPAGQ